MVEQPRSYVIPSHPSRLHESQVIVNFGNDQLKEKKEEKEEEEEKKEEKEEEEEEKMEAGGTQAWLVEVVTAMAAT